MKHILRILIAAAIGPGTAHLAIAQEKTEDAPAPRTGILWIDWAAEQVAFTIQEAAPADDAPAEGARPMPELAPTHSVETMEMMRLQQEVRLLRELIEEGVVNRVMTLENEVRDLKSALRTQRGGAPVVPQPDTPATARLPEPEMAVPSPTPSAPVAEAAPTEPKAASEAFSFTVVDEWGRSPEAVAELGNGASTLIGLSGLVPAGSARADVVGLARDLRAKYRDYDNIVIEIFDSEEAALAFAESQQVDEASRVLSISRARTDGRDLTIYYGGELPEPLTAGEG